MITIKRLSSDMVVQVEKTPLIKIQIIDGVKLYNSDCVIVIAARPGIGKTNTACKIASQYAKSNKTVLYYSGEMPCEMIAHRLHDIYGCDNADLNNILCIDTVVDVSQIGCAVETVNPDLIIIDQISLLNPPREFYGDMANSLAAAENIKALVSLQRKLKIPVVVLSQINRKSDDKKGLDLDRIALSDAIGQFATVVIGVEKLDNSAYDFAYKYTVLKSRYGADKWEYTDEYDKDIGWVKDFEFNT